jgi:hypothetical protein
VEGGRCVQNFSVGTEKPYESTSTRLTGRWVKVRVRDLPNSKLASVDTLSLTEYRKPTQIICSVLFCFVTSCSLVRSSETLVTTYKTTRHHKAEDHRRHLHLPQTSNGYIALLVSLLYIMAQTYTYMRSRGSSVSIVSDYGLDDRGSIPDRRRGFFL